MVVILLGIAKERLDGVLDSVCFFFYDGVYCAEEFARRRGGGGGRKVWCLIDGPIAMRQTESR